MVASKQLRLAVETEEERARLENDAATNSSGWPRKWTKKEKTDGSYQHIPCYSLIKGVVNVGVVLSLKPILKGWQLCLSFKLDVATT